MKELILICYLLCIILTVSGLTMAVLARKKGKSEVAFAMILFLAGILVICCYDMAIYYSDYVLGGMSILKVLRIGNSIIAGAICLWILMQSRIIERDALSGLDKGVQRYLVFYMVLWLVLTFAMGVEKFYTFKWLLLATDIILIIASVTASVGHIVYAMTTKKKTDLYYMILVTSMLLWNYLSYFWSEASIYWGNSRFIREPMDLTVVFWLVISIVSLFYEYKEDFVKVFEKKAAGESKRDLKERIAEVCEQYRLTPREKELVELIYSGKSNKEIAEILFLSESTVKTHIYNIFRKMEVKSRVEVIYIVNEENGEHDAQEEGKEDA